MNPKDKHADWLLKPTANDLADELDRMLKAIGLTGNRIPTILRQQEVEIKRITSKYEEMLRQQQAEIEAMKANRKHDFGLGEASGFIKGHKENPYKAITNTKIEPTVVSYTHPVKEQGNPVAWRSQAPDGYWSVYQSPVEGAEPLYTGFKELTDDEINAVWFNYKGDIKDFDRAILRKASEK